MAERLPHSLPYRVLFVFFFVFSSLLATLGFLIGVCQVIGQLLLSHVMFLVFCPWGQHQRWVPTVSDLRGGLKREEGQSCRKVPF